MTGDPAGQVEPAPLHRPPVGPAVVLGVIAAWLVVMWAAFLLVDAWNVAGLRDRFAAWTDGRIEPALWLHLFNDRPTEWLQWVMMAVLAPSAGYLAGRLRSLGYPGASGFYAVLGLAAGVMLIEDAGDVRHVVSGYLHRLVGAEVAGLHFSTISDLIIFGAIAFVPIYALLRYGRYVWRSPRTRPHLIAGYGLYAIAGGGSGLRWVGDLYQRLGAGFHRLLGGDIPVPPTMSESGMYYRLIDRVVEESIELLAVTFLLATVLAFARDVADGGLAPETAVPRP